MAIARWSAPGDEISLGSAGLNSLANNSASSVTELDNSTTRALYARVDVVLGSITPTSGAALVLVVVGQFPGPEWQDEISSNLRYSAMLRTSVGVHRITYPRVFIPPFLVGIQFLNYSNVTLAATGNSVSAYLYGEEIV